MTSLGDGGERCRYEILGPLVGGRKIPLWRRRCRNRVRAGETYCHVHRKVGIDDRRF